MRNYQTFGQVVAQDVFEKLPPTYVIKRNGRKFNKMCFDSYEAARQYVRKWLRKNLGRWAYTTPDGSNPVMGEDGFTIVKV